MAALSAFHSRIFPLVPSCPVPTVEQALVDSCIEFCEQGSAVHRELDPVTLVAGSQELEIDLPPQSGLIRVTSVVVNDRELQPSDRIFADVQGMPRTYSYQDDGVLALYPTPDQTYEARVFALLKPARGATAVDDILFEDWAEFIVSGAMYRLLSMPMATWANPAAAQAYFNNFRMGINRSELEFRRRRTTKEMRVQFVRV